MQPSRSWSQQAEALLSRKRSVFVFLILLVGIFLSGNVFALALTDTDGDGYKEIHNCQELQAMKDNVVSSMYSYTGDFELANNIDCSETKNWDCDSSGVCAGFAPVVRCTESLNEACDVTQFAYTGSFKGNGFNISNLYIRRFSKNSVGLFGYFAGKASGVGLLNSDITGSWSVGTLAGFSAGSARFNTEFLGPIGSDIKDVYATGNINSSGRTAGGIVGTQLGGVINNSYFIGNVSGSGVGGIVGYLWGGQVWNSYFLGDINGGNGCGGIAGRSQLGVNAGSIIANCYAIGNVVGGKGIGGLAGAQKNSISINSYFNGNVKGTNYVGGLVGIMEDVGTVKDIKSHVSNCYSSGTVTGEASVGGVVGYGHLSVITNSYSTSNVVGNSEVGGVLGYSHFPVVTYKSYAAGSVTGVNNVGGFAGMSGKVSNCFAKGDVNGVTKVGGLIGWQSGTGSKTTYSYAVGKVNGSTDTGGLATNVRGLVGYWSPLLVNTVLYSFYNKDNSGGFGSNVGGPKTTEQMKTKSTFVNTGWDFTNVWKIDSSINEGYPYLDIIVPTSRIDGVCGSIDLNFCESGILYGMDNNGTHYFWNCAGLGEGTTSSCILSSEAITPANGECGIEINQCTKGNLWNNPDNDTHYLWLCISTDANGKYASCSAIKPGVNLSLYSSQINVLNGSCGDVLNLCVNGTLLDIEDNSTHYLWNCVVVNGINASCLLSSSLSVSSANVAESYNDASANIAELPVITPANLVKINTSFKEGPSQIVTSSKGSSSSGNGSTASVFASMGEDSWQNFLFIPLVVLCVIGAITLIYYFMARKKSVEVVSSQN